MTATEGWVRPDLGWRLGRWFAAVYVVGLVVLVALRDVGLVYGAIVAYGALCLACLVASVPLAIALRTRGFGLALMRASVLAAFVASIVTAMLLAVVLSQPGVELS